MVETRRFGLIGVLTAFVAVGCGSPLDEVEASGSDEGSSTGGDAATATSDPGPGSDDPSDGPGDADGDGTTSGPPPATTGGTTAGDDESDSSDGDTGTAEPTCTPFPEMEDFADTGPFEITEGQQGPSCTLFRPSNLGEDGRRHPIILWGNGTFTTPAIYGGVLRHWASQGFIVAAANTSNAGSGQEMLACLDWLTEQSADESSEYFEVVDLDHVGTTGHSQGGGGALMAGQDPRITATAPLQPYTEQGFGDYDQACQSNQNGPMFLMSGDADVVAPIDPNQIRVFEDTNVPTLWGTLAGGDHIFAPIGDITRYRGPATAWFRYHLMCDETARPWFYDECLLCDDGDWDVQTANW